MQRSLAVVIDSQLVHIVFNQRAKNFQMPLHCGNLMAAVESVKQFQDMSAAIPGGWYEAMNEYVIFTWTYMDCGGSNIEL